MRDRQQCLALGEAPAYADRIREFRSGNIPVPDPLDGASFEASQRFEQAVSAGFRSQTLHSVYRRVDEVDGEPCETVDRERITIMQHVFPLRARPHMDPRLVRPEKFKLGKAF